MVTKRKNRNMKDWYTAQQIADLLGLHINTIKRLSPAILPYYRMLDRGDRRYRKEDVEKFLQDRLVNR